MEVPDRWDDRTVKDVGMFVAAVRHRMVTARQLVVAVGLAIAIEHGLCLAALVLPSQPLPDRPLDRTWLRGDILVPVQVSLAGGGNSFGDFATWSEQWALDGSPLRLPTDQISRPTSLGPWDIPIDQRPLRPRELRTTLAVQAGWPVRCYEGRVVLDWSGATLIKTAWMRRLPLDSLDRPLVPLTPRLVPLAADVVLLAVAIMAIVSVGRLLVWRRRVSAGRCWGCGYPLHGQDGVACPECGRDQPARPDAGVERSEKKQVRPAGIRLGTL